MKITTLIGICTLTAATVFGCSAGSSSSGNSGGNDTAGEDAGGSSGAGASSSGASSSGASSSGASSSGSSSGSTSSSGGSSSGSTGPDDAGIATTDAAPGNDPEIDYTETKTITMETFTVQPGAEVYKCQSFANPWGAQVDIKTYSLDMAAGSHHMFAFYESGATNGAVADCPNGGNTFGAFTFTSQSQKISQTYPATVGATIPAGTGFNMMVHYLNTGSTPIQSSVKLTMYVGKAGAVSQHAGVIFLNDIGIIVPPGISQQSPLQPYTLPQDVNILFSASHMHKEATNFIATAGSQTLFTTTEWAEPAAKQFSPPLLLKAGTTINWTCTYDNMTATTLTFGESAASNVMCISTSIFYPVTDVNNPVLGNAATF